METRYELCFFENNTKISDISPLPSNIGTIYLRSDIATISENRATLIDQDFTTRLFVDKNNGNGNKYYIYGRKKKNKGIFNEHCKNTVADKPDFFAYILDTHTDEGSTVLTDSESFYNSATQRQTLEVTRYEG